MHLLRWARQGPFRRAIRLSAFAATLASVLSWPRLARWLAAAAVVAGTRILSERVKVQWQPLPVSSSSGRRLLAPAPATEPQAAAATQLARPRVPRERDAWRTYVGSETVVAAWDKLCASIVQEFVYDSWFAALSPDREFPAEVRWQLNHAFGETCRRAARVDWAPLLARHTSAALCSTLQLYRTGTAALGGSERLRQMPADEADAALCGVLARNRLLHPAFNSPDGRYRCCRRLAEAVLCHILPPDDRACPMMRALLRELFAACVLRSALNTLSPYSVSKALLHMMGAGGPPRLLTAAQQQTAGEFERRARASCRAEAEHVSRARAERRSRKSLLGLAGAGGVVPSVTAALAAAAERHAAAMQRSRSVSDARIPSWQAALLVRGGGGGSGGLLQGPARGGSTSTKRHDSSGSGGSSGGSGSARNSPGNLLSAHALGGGVGAVRAAAQQLSLRTRLVVGGESRAAVRSSAVPAPPTGTGSPPASASATDSPRSWSTADLTAVGSPLRQLAARAVGSVSRAVTTSSTDAYLEADNAGTSGCASPTAMPGLCGLARASSAATVAARALRIEHLDWRLPAPAIALHARVASAELLSLDGRDIIVYRICVGDEQAEWTVTRRYRHFEALHRRLRDCPALRGLTDGLPPKRLLTARDAPFVMRRRDELDRYLQALLAHAELARHPELQQFLGAEGRTRAACTEVGSSTPLSTPRPAVPAAGKETCMSPESTATGECSTHSNICSGADGENALCATSNSSGDGCTAQGATACSGSSCSSDSNLMLASRTRSAPATSSRLQHSVGTADTAVPPTGCASSVLVRTRRDAGAASEVGCKEGAAVATTSGIETAQPELSAAARRTQHLQSPTGSELKQHQMQHQQQQQQRQEDELEHCGPSLPSAGASCALAKRTARQPSNRSVRARQQVLTGNQLPASTRRLQENDSGDASCSLPRQSPAVPTQPSSPPVPNRMLPQPSLLLEDTAALAGPTEGGHSLAITPTHSDTPAAAATTGTMPCKQRLLLPTAALVSAAEVLQQQQQLDAASEQPGQPAQQQETQLHHPRPSVKPSPLGDADESAPKAHAITAASPASPGSAVRTPARRRSRSRSLRHGSALSALGDASLRSVSPASAGAALPPCESPAIIRVAPPHTPGEARLPPDTPGEARLPPDTPGGAEDWAGALPPWGALDADGADADYEDDGPDNSGLIRPLYELVSCVFELRSAGFVRRPVISLVRQLLSLLAGGAIDDLLQRTLSGVLSDQSVAAQLVRLQGQLWPGGVWFARAAAPPGGTPARPPPVSAERYLDWPPPPDAPDVAAALREALHAAAVPAPLLALLGKGAYARALDDVHSMLQSRTLMQHCGFLMLEAALSALFPEIRSTLKAIHTTGPP